jgi:hypothetical protein
MEDPNDDKELQHILMIGFTVWNSVTFADAVGKDTPMKEISKILKEKPDCRPLIERLIERKKTLYGDDNRLIGDYQVRTVNGEVRLKVEAGSPY